MAIRLAKAMGNEVTAISTSPNKAAVAKSIGATNFVISKDEESMKAAANSLDLILNTVSANHEAATYIPLLRTNGVLVMLGVTINDHKVGAGVVRLSLPNSLPFFLFFTPIFQISIWPMMMKRTSLASSAIGGLQETQDVIDFCDRHKILPEIKIVTKDDVPGVYEKLAGKNDSITRYVLDIDKSMNM